MDSLAILVVSALAVLLVAREMTWRRALAGLRQRIAAADVHLREQGQLAQMGQLVSGLAQELKSPLQGVIGNTELMLATGGAGVDSTDELREIQEHAARAAGIVRSLVAFSETTSLNRRWQDLNELARRAVDCMRTDLDAGGVRVSFALADRLPMVYVDGRQLEKAISTILARFAPSHRLSEGVPVTLTTRRGDPDDRLVIELDDRTAANPVAADDRSWAGDLGVCRRIVEAHGGSLEVGRPEYGGNRFHLELPVTAGGAAPDHVTSS
jgi:signal transduction histidine kinase